MNTPTNPRPPASRRELVTTTSPPRIRKILVTTDFSEASRAGTRHAAALARSLGASLQYLHVVEPPPRLAGVDAVLVARPEANWEGQARVQLEDLARLEAPETVPFTTSVRTGKAVHEILTAAHEGDVDLVVLATHGRSGLEHALLGSTAERVVRHAPCPVMTVPARWAASATGAPALRLQRIVVPIDFSNLSKEALPYAVLLAREHGAEIVLLHVVEEFPIDHLLGAELMSETSMPMIRQAEADLSRLAMNLRETTGLAVTLQVEVGKPHAQICGAAGRQQADLVILTTHGLTGLKHWWLGSTAERVVRHAPCAVLVVREMEHAFAAMPAGKETPGS